MRVHIYLDGCRITTAPNFKQEVFAALHALTGCISITRITHACYEGKDNGTLLPLFVNASLDYALSVTNRMCVLADFS